MYMDVHGEASWKYLRHARDIIIYTGARIELDTAKSSVQCMTASLGYM